MCAPHLGCVVDPEDGVPREVDGLVTARSFDSRAETKQRTDGELKMDDGWLQVVAFGVHARPSDSRRFHSTFFIFEEGLTLLLQFVFSFIDKETKTRRQTHFMSSFGFMNDG